MARNTGVLKQARRFRKEMTRAEKVLWEELRRKKLGLKIRRQMPFVFGDYRYVVDFHCPQIKLIIEVDGDIHNDLEIKEIDQFREEVFIDSGYRVVRFSNYDVINNMNIVLDKIISYLP